MRPAAALLLVALALPSRAADEPAFDWVLTLENGDILHVGLIAIDGNRLVVRWQVSPDEPLRLDLQAISYLARDAEDGQGITVPEDQDMLRLADDSILYGRAKSIRPEGVVFDVPQVGQLSIPAENILDLTRGGKPVEPPRTKDGEFGIAMRSGVALAGALLVGDDGRIRVEGGGVTATVDWDAVAAIAFPRPTPRGAEDESLALGVEVKLRNGSVVAGREPVLGDGTLGFKAGGIEASVALTEVASISFREYGVAPGRASLRTVLAWGRWSDPGEEFRRTIDALKSQDDRWNIRESMADRYDDAFRREVCAARVLLIPEMERLPATGTDGKEIRPILETFLRSGGNVVICGAQSAQHFEWLRDAGLIEIEAAGQVDGHEVTFTPKGAAEVQGVAAFRAVNATHAYAIRSRDAVSFAEAAGKTVVAGRRVGRGWVIVLGPDFFMSNDGASKMLAKLIALR
jgi:hypothetical protein